MGHVNADEILVAELAEARENLAVMTEEASRLEALLEQRATGEADAALRIAYLEERVLDLQLALMRERDKATGDSLGSSQATTWRVVDDRSIDARKQEQAVRDADLRAVHARLAVNGAALPEGPVFDAILAGIDDLGARAARTLPGTRARGDDASAALRDRLTMWRQGAAKLLGLDPDGPLDDDKGLLYSLSKARWAPGSSAIALNNLNRLRVGIAAALGLTPGDHADDDLETGVRDQRIALESARTGLDTIARRVTAFEGDTVLQKVHNAVAALGEAGAALDRLRNGLASLGGSGSDDALLAHVQKLHDERYEALAKLDRWEEAGTPYLITCPERLSAAIELGKDTETMLKGELTEVREYLAEALDGWEWCLGGSRDAREQDERRIAELRKHAAPNPRPAPIETAGAS